jgi:hypothetical protein
MRSKRASTHSRSTGYFCSVAALPTTANKESPDSEAGARLSNSKSSPEPLRSLQRKPRQPEVHSTGRDLILRRIAVARWPAARITLRQGIRVVHDTR